MDRGPPNPVSVIKPLYLSPEADVVHKEGQNCISSPCFKILGRMVFFTMIIDWVGKADHAPITPDSRLTDWDEGRYVNSFAIASE